MARNVHLRVAEIDVVARDGDCLVFVEVRARSSSRCGHATETLSFAKRQRMRRAASIYLARASGTKHRIDLAAVTLAPGSNQVVDFTWIKDITG